MARVADVQKYMASIRNVDIFRYLLPDELEKLLKVTELVQFNAEETIITQGETGQHLFAVLSGSVDVSVRELEDEKFVLSHLKAGGLFGEAAIFLKEERSASVTTVEKSVVLQIDRKDLLDYIRLNPIAGNKILLIIVLSLLAKLRAVNREFVFEKQAEIDYQYVDSLVRDFMKRS
jgi:CRP-like cAMP-binding protein